MADRVLMMPDELNDGAAFLRQQLEVANQEVYSIKSKI